MVSEGKVIEALEKSINRLGNLFQEKSVYYFWWEEDLRAWLMHFFFEAVEQIPTVRLSAPPLYDPWPGQSGSREVALAHLVPTATKGHFDLCIFDPDAALEFVRIFNEHEIIQKGKLIATVDISYLFGKTLKEKVAPDIDKAVKNIDRIRHAYVLVFALSKTEAGRQWAQYKNMSKDLEDMWRQKSASERVKIFCVSDDRSVKPTWILPNVLIIENPQAVGS